MRDFSSETNVATMSALQTRTALSWGGVFAGVFVAIALQLLFNLLGIGVGASSIDATHGDQPGQGMAIGALLWFVLSWILSLAIGAWVASQFSLRGNRLLGALQGLLVWSVSSVVLIYLLSTAAGKLIGGTASVIGRTAALVGAGVQNTAPGVAGLASQATGVTTADISAQAGDIASDPQFKQILSDVVTTGTFSQSDRAALQNLLVQRGHLTPEQASSDLDKWQAEISNGANSAKTTALNIENKAASGVSATGFGSFFSLLLGLFAAVAGGVFGNVRRFSFEARAAR